MRTTNFDTISFEIQADGSLNMYLKDIDKSEFEVSLTADELMLFSAELGNAIADARRVELELRKQADIEREQRRAHK